MVSAAGCTLVAGIDDDYVVATAAGGTSGGTGGSGACTPGAQEACYSGTVFTQGQGLCKVGMRTCNADGSAWGGCEGEVVPREETCDEAGDEDCDGLANEGGVNCSCKPMVDTKSCYTGPSGTAGKGECQMGAQTCDSDGDGYGPCMGEVTPKPEDCSTANADDDCDEVEIADPMKKWDTGDCACRPTEMAACYTGPAETEGVGICIPGMGECKPDGLGVVMCQGEITPSAESCSAPADEDCDGTNPLCPGDTHWSKRGAGTGDQVGYGIAADAAGNVFVGGSFSNAIDFGNGALNTNQDKDVFLTKWDPNGTQLFHQRYGSGGVDTLAKIAVDGQGNVVVGGTYDGATIDFGGGPLMNTGNIEGFVAKLSGTSMHVWSRRLGGSSNDYVTGVAVTPAGDVLVTGVYAGTPDFGKGPLPMADGLDYYLAKLAAGTGETAWVKAWAGSNNQFGLVVASDTAGNAVVTGRHFGNVDFGGGAIDSTDADIFVGKFAAADGAHMWSKAFISPGFQQGKGVVVDSGNNVIVAGVFQGTVDFGGGPATAMSDDAFVLKLNSGGAYVWRKVFAGMDKPQDAVDVALGPSDSVIVAGQYDFVIDFEAIGPLGGGSGGDAFVVKLDSAGTPLWKKGFAGSGQRRPNDVGADSAGNALVTGDFNPQIDFGQGNMHMSLNEFDAFVVKLEK